MQSCEIKIKIPQGLLVTLHKTPGEIGEDIRKQAAIRYYRNRSLSLGKSAELAGMTRFDFIDYLRFNDEPVFNYTDDELEEIRNDSIQLEKIIDE